MWGNYDAGRDRSRVEKYLKFHKDYIFRWLGGRINLDVVIEGYDMRRLEYREMVNDLLCQFAWPAVEFRELKRA